MKKQDIYDYLDKNSISYTTVEHPPAFTVDDILSFHLPNPELGAKNLFLRDDKKQNYYLLTVKEDKEFSIKDFQTKADTRRLSFASEEDLMRIMNLTRGSVSPFGVLNDKDLIVKVYLDSYFNGKKICIHPNENTASLYIESEDLIRIIRQHGNSVEFIEI